MTARVGRTSLRRFPDAAATSTTRSALVGAILATAARHLVRSGAQYGHPPARCRYGNARFDVRVLKE